MHVSGLLNNLPLLGKENNRFVATDALWSLCMACNVYLTLFRRYSTAELKQLEWKYFLFCYGLPFVPAFVFLFVETESEGKVYGPAIVSRKSFTF